MHTNTLREAIHVFLQQELVCVFVVHVSCFHCKEAGRTKAQCDHSSVM